MPPSSLTPVKSLAPPAPASPPGRAFDDVDAYRTNLYDGVLKSVVAAPPVKVGNFSLGLSDVSYADPPDVTAKDRKTAILRNETLARRLRGTLTLTDLTTNTPVATKPITIARVPKPTADGTMVLNGVEWTLGNQLRLRPGVFVRKTHAGDVEAHVNVAPGTGATHHYAIDPKTNVFKIRVGQSNIPLAPLLRKMGATDADFAGAWGSEIAQANKKVTAPDAMQKLYARVVRRAKSAGPDADPDGSVVAAFKAMAFDPAVTKRTLGTEHANVDARSILNATKKILAVRRGEADPDDRDAMVYQSLLGPEDLIAERTRLMPKALRQIAFKAAMKKSLDHAPADFFGPYLRAAITDSGLGQALEEVNPVETLGQLTRVSRLGVGGISSAGAAPSESKSVQPSQYGFIDFDFSPESEAAGLDMRLAGGARKGENGEIYTRVRDTKTGELTWKTPRDLADESLAFAQEQPDARGMVRAIVAGRLGRAPEKTARYRIDQAEDAYNPLLQLVPLKGGAKGQRVSMAARMTTQSVPLVDPEAPLVRVADGDDPAGSMEKRYGTRVGAVRAKGPGEVVDVSGEAITIKSDDGKTVTHTLAQNSPFNRKTSLTQSGVVKVGQRVKPGDLLATSNFTDKDGVVALGKNLRTAFIPARGYSFEDAWLISESAAKKLTSRHAFQHAVEFDHTSKNNRNAFVSLFPSAYNRDQLNTLDDDGIVKVGTRVQKGDPLVLRASQVERSHNKVARGRFGGYSDQTDTWDYRDEGVVTDVERTPKGVVVAVASDRPTKEGDKIVIRHGSKGLTGRVVPDDEMPQDSQGRPFEALINPLTVITRRNPSQVVEAVLGKVAQKTGKPYAVPSFFTNDEEMLDLAANEARKHGVSDKEDVFDPVSGRTIPGVLTGVNYFLKLHHDAENKSSGRGLGAYGQDDSPAKTGGPEGSAKRFSLADSQAALAHGAHAFLRDVKEVRSQKNDDYWAQLMAGRNPTPPRVSAHHERFLSMLTAGGLHPIRTGSQIRLTALLDKDVDELAGDNAVTTGDTVKWDKGLEPVPGGLFDVGCFVGSTQIWTEQGMQRIDKIVRERLPLRVWSYDFSAKAFVLKPIVNWFRNRAENGVGDARLSEPACFGERVARVFRCLALIGTASHEVYQLDGRKIPFSEASQLVTVSEFFSDAARQVLYGSLLGDLHVKPSGAMSLTHSSKQRAWFDFKVQALGENPETVYVTTDSVKGKLYESVRIGGRTHAEYREARRVCYDARGKKRVTKKLLDLLDARGLAVWFADDGCRDDNNRPEKLRFRLATERYTRKEIGLLVRWLAKRWEVKVSLYRDGKRYGGRDMGWVLRISGRAAERFISLIAPYLPENLVYKLGPKPELKNCDGCGKSIANQFKRCNRCTLALPTRDTGAIRTAVVSRFGSVEAVKALQLSGELPDDCPVADRWDRLRNAWGSAFSQFAADCHRTLGLRPVSAKFTQGRLKWHRENYYAYDIEVEDTHNYFANGVLVGNSTGGHGSKRWAKIELPEPMPSPAFEDPIRWTLGLTEKKLRNVLAGREEINGKTGPEGLRDALAAVNVDKEIETAKRQWETRKGVGRDHAARRWSTLERTRRNGIHPKDWMVTKVPVLPAV